MTFLIILQFVVYLDNESVDTCETLCLVLRSSKVVALTLVSSSFYGMSFFTQLAMASQILIDCTEIPYENRFKN